MCVGYFLSKSVRGVNEGILGVLLVERLGKYRVCRGVGEVWKV